MQSIAGVLVKKDGRYLLVQEKLEHVYGKWNIPAGHVDEGETNDVAAKREAEEETGYRVKLLSVAIIRTIAPPRGINFYIFPAEIVGGEMKINNEEVLDVKWFTPEEIQNLDLREPTFKDLFA